MESIFRLLTRLQDDMPMLDLEHGKTPYDSQYWVDYANYYDLFWLDITHHFGWFLAKKQKIAAHIFAPENPRGTFFYHHGYTDHSANAGRLIRHLTRQGFQVATFDALGHGLSEGPRGYVSDFSDYLKCLESFIHRVADECPKPFYLLGHSLGGAIVKEYLFRHDGGARFNDVILLAPLVRLHGAPMIQLKYRLIHRVINEVPRKFKKGTSDPEVTKFLQTGDPLQLKTIPLAWVKAYYSWYKRAHSYGECGRKVHVIQGNKDKTVDWKYNCGFIEKKFPGSEILLIDGARHALLGEIPAYWQQMLNKIDAVLAPA